MRRIPENVIDDIRAKSDIVETVSSYLPLTKRGKNYWGLCPFHDDNNPSMSVSPDRQIYKCFVCGAGGNVFTFIEHYDKINFIEAVAKQANNIHFDISDYSIMPTRTLDPKIERLQSLMEEVKNFTSYQLSSKEGEEALVVLKKRGYTQEILNNFEVGVAFSNNQIHKFLSAKGFTDDEMLSADIIRIGENQLQDVFYNRLMFPIKNQYGKVVAFSGRTLDPDGKVKYINTRETDIYTKGEHIYNLDKVKSGHRTVDSLVITEGVTDVFAFTMAGFDATVSLLGVACTDQQLRLIKSTSQSVILAFDGDKAGREATLSIGQKLVNAHVSVSIWYNDTDLDPDELLRQHGAKKVLDGIENAISWLDFIISYGVGQYGLESFDNKLRIVNFVFPYLEHEDLLTQDFYLQRLGEITGFDKETLKSQVRKTNPSQSEIIITTPKFENHFTQDVSRAELEILRQMLLSKEAANIYRDELGFLPNDLAHEFTLVLLDLYRTKERIEIADILSLELEDNLRGFIIEFEDRLSIQTYQKEIIIENIQKIKKKIDLENIAMNSKEISKSTTLDDQLSLLENMIKKKRKL